MEHEENEIICIILYLFIVDKKISFIINYSLVSYYSLFLSLEIA